MALEISVMRNLLYIWLIVHGMKVFAEEGIQDESSVIKAVKHVYEGYDKNIRPPNGHLGTLKSPVIDTPNIKHDGGDPVDIGVDVYVISLSAISEKTMDYTVNMYIRQRWQDTRLAHPNFTGENGILINSQIAYTWLPDLFIKNDKESEKSDVTTLNTFLRVNDEGKLTYSMRVTSTIACSMHLARYPFDVQYCDMLFESYGHSTNELKFHWNEANGQPVEINDKIKLPEHIIKETYTKNCTKTYNTTGAFSCISIQFEFARNVNYYIMGLFLPTILIVVLSWVAFWIDKSSTPGRVSLSLLTILTMQNQMSSTLAQLPKVSYIKLVDVWLTGCLAFVFAGFLEYALVNKLATKERDKQKGYSISQGLKTALTGATPVAGDLLPEKDALDTCKRCHSNFPEDSPMVPLNGEASQFDPEIRRLGPRSAMSMADKVDFYSRFLFPLAFLLFNLVLWMSYLIPENSNSPYTSAEGHFL